VWMAGHGVWRSLVARFVRDEEAAGSNPVTPTSVFTGERPAPELVRASFAASTAAKYSSRGPGGLIPATPPACVALLVSTLTRVDLHRHCHVCMAKNHGCTPRSTVSRPEPSRTYWAASRSMST